MPLPPAHLQISESDFEAIESAVKETARGRWFLEEFAQRNRHADTLQVLEAIQRLQRSVLGAETAPASAPAVIDQQISGTEQAAAKAREDVSEFERIAEKTRSALSEIDAARLRDGDLGRELGGIVMVQAQAISEILSDADRIAEIAGTMRAQGIAENVCDQLDGLTTHITTACAFQDLTGQRTQKVVVALRALETRVAALVKLWQAESKEQAPASDALLSGPAREGEGMEQDQIDELLSIDQDHDVFWNGQDGTATARPETIPAATQPAAMAAAAQPAEAAFEMPESAKAPVEPVTAESAPIERAQPATAPSISVGSETAFAATAAAIPEMQTAPQEAAPPETSSKRPSLERLTADERLALFA